MNTLADFLLQIEPGTDLTRDGILARVEVEKHRLLFGGMDRPQFEAAVFRGGDLVNLPVIHLLDHRVRMPRYIADEIIAGGSPGIAAVLKRRLCASHHSEGARLVGQAIGVDVEMTAENAVALEADHPKFVRLCLTGQHGNAIMFLRQSEVRAASTSMRQLLIDCALVYGALDLQLIAARQKALDAIFADEDNKSTCTIGPLLQKLDAMVAGIRRAAAGVQTDLPMPGRRPVLVSVLEANGHRYLADKLANGEVSSQPAVLASLRETYPALLEITDDISSQIREALTRVHSETGPKAATLSGRTLISTARAGGMSGGWQLTYASLRLIALKGEVRAAVDRLLAGQMLDHAGFFTKRLPAWSDAGVEALLAVSRSIIWQTTGVDRAFRSDGAEASIESSIRAYREAGRPAGEDIIKRTKKHYTQKWHKKRAPLTDGQLPAPALWDILPDFRFLPGSRQTVTARTEFQEPKGYVTKPHQPSPRYRAPRRAYR